MFGYSTLTIPQLSEMHELYTYSGTNRPQRSHEAPVILGDRYFSRASLGIQRSDDESTHSNICTSNTPSDTTTDLEKYVLYADSIVASIPSVVDPGAGGP